MKIKNIRKVTNYRHLNIFEVDYVDRFQKNKQWQIASRQAEPRCVTGSFADADAVVIVPYHVAADRLVIIEEFRVPLGGYQFGFPAGLVDEGESVEQAVKRELREETGLVMTSLLTASPPLYSSSGMSDESIVMVYVKCDGKPSNLENEGSEEIKTLLVTREEAGSICTRPDIKIDVKTWLVLKTFSETGKL